METRHGERRQVLTPYLLRLRVCPSSLRDISMSRRYRGLLVRSWMAARGSVSAVRRSLSATAPWCNGVSGTSAEIHSGEVTWPSVSQPDCGGSVSSAPHQPSRGCLQTRPSSRPTSRSQHRAERIPDARILYLPAVRGGVWASTRLSGTVASASPVYAVLLGQFVRLKTTNVPRVASTRSFEPSAVRRSITGRTVRSQRHR